MKIVLDLLQSTGTKGGIESYIRALYSEFNSMDTGHEFIGFAPTEFLTDIAREWFPGEIHKSRYSGENRFQWAVGELFGVSEFAQSIKADLIHAPAMLGPLHSSIPVVLTIHDLSYFTHPHLMRNRLLTPGVKMMEKLATRNATSIISISESTTALIPKYLKVSPDKISTVLSSGASVQPCTNENRVHTNRPTFLAMGQRSPYKSLETAIQAMAYIPPDIRPKLIVTGSHGKDPLLPLVHKLDLQDDVELLTWVDEDQLRTIMCSSVALIETTVAAGFGMPAVEAMTMGVPVISSDIPVFREILSDGALFFSAGNEHHLAEVIQAVLVDQSQLEATKLNGKRIASKYSWRKTASETLDVFEQAALIR